jgi:CheY-like chemotaxis protein
MIGSDANKSLSANGAAALAEIQELVISDISLRDADGLERLRQIYSDFPYLDVIAMSGFMAAIPAATWRDAGNHCDTRKAFTPRQLLCSVSELLRPPCVSMVMG